MVAHDRGSGDVVKVRAGQTGGPAGPIVRERVPISTTIDRAADERIRVELLRRKVTVAAFWEEMSVVLAERPDLLAEVIDRAETATGGRLRRPTV